jgi:hypothetical protein
MMNKQRELIRDLAKLFVKYDLTDWRIIIDALRKGGSEYDALRQAIEHLASKPEPGSRPRKQAGAERLFAELEERDPRKAEVLTELHARLTAKKLAPRLADLREVCLRLSLKDNLPNRREDAVLFILRHLVSLNEEELVFALKQIPAKDRNLQDEYNKWFQMIYTSGRST